jgi:hypothetical protein
VSPLPPPGSLAQGAPPTYFIVAGLVFTPATVPYLRSEYGKEYDYDAPVSHNVLQGRKGGGDAVEHCCLQALPACAASKGCAPEALRSWIGLAVSWPTPKTCCFCNNASAGNMCDDDVCGARGWGRKACIRQCVFAASKAWGVMESVIVPWH